MMSVARIQLPELLVPALITLAIFAGLPMIDSLVRSRDRDFRLLDARLAIPPPPPPPAPRQVEPPPRTTPELEREIPRMLIPVQASLSLNSSMEDLSGDFALQFAITAPTIGIDQGDYIFEISELDAPPRALQRLNPQYPPHARMMRVEGHVQVEFVVGAGGKVSGASILNSEPKAVFDAATLRAVKRWTFAPGTRDGQAVPVRVRQNVTFTLER